MANTPNIISTIINPMSVAAIVKDVSNIAEGARESDPLISEKLSRAAEKLFGPNQFGQMFVNPFALGQVIFALDYLAGKNQNNDGSQDEAFMWSCIHPAIVKSSKQLYDDGHFADAAVHAFIELNDRAKSRYKAVRPSESVIPDGRDLMNKLFSPNGPILQVHCSVQDSERDYRDGFYFMAAGAMAALRNPKSHSNEEVLSAEEAMRRLMFASMLMFELDKATPA